LFSLEEGKYARLAPDDQGIIESRIFPGLRLNVGALLSGDLAKALDDLRQGIESAAHTGFVRNPASRLRKE
jgi:hypothetical protein